MLKASAKKCIYLKEVKRNVAQGKTPLLSMKYENHEKGEFSFSWNKRLTTFIFLFNILHLFSSLLYLTFLLYSHGW